MNSIKDLIYFDLEKAQSIISQLNKGLVSEISKAFGNEDEDSAGIGFDIKVIKGNIGEKSKEKTLKTEKITLFHELLNEVESELEKRNILNSINETFNNHEGSFKDYLNKIPDFTYIKATGWGSFEDFERFKRIFTNFNDIQRLIYESAISENPEAVRLKKQLSDSKKIANQNKDRNAKSKDLAKIKAFEKKLDDFLEEETEIHLFDEEWIGRMKKLLDTFSPNRLNFRLLPLDDYGDFQILSDLKAKYMVNGDFENTIFTYGSRPNIKLTVMGIITSCPRLEDNRIHPSDEYLEFDENDLSDESHFDKAFRNVFDSFEAFEKFFFVPNYPKIAISPIAIYREIITDK